MQATPEFEDLRDLLRPVGDFYAWSRDYWIELGRSKDGVSSGMLTFGLWDPGTQSMFEAQENLLQLIVHSLGELPPAARGLDIGCGIGGAAVRLAGERDVTLTCMDLVPAHLEIGRKRAQRAGMAGRIKFRLGSSMNMPLADESFDFSCCIESSFHYPDKQAFFHENFRVLKPGGVAVLADITCEDNSLVTFRNDNYFIAIEEMQRLIRATGFSVESTENIGDRVFRPLLRYVEKFNAGRRDKLRRYWNLVLKNYAVLSDQGKMGYEVFVLRKGHRR